MSQAISRWETMRTNDSRKVEEILRQRFPRADAYRYNSASIRVRVIDPEFEGKSREERYDLVEPLLKQLPADIQADIMNLVILAPNETGPPSRSSAANVEFEDPSPSVL